MAHLKVIKSEMPYAGSTKIVFGLFDSDARQVHVAATAFLLRKMLNGARPSSLRTYAYCLAPFLQKAEEDPRISHWDSVTDEHLAAYFEHVLVHERKLTGKSLKLIRTVLKAFYDWALEYGWTKKKRCISYGTVEAIQVKIKIDTCRDNSLDRFKIFTQFIPTADFKSLLMWVSPKHEFEKQRDIICLKLGYLSGWRRSEVVDPTNIATKRIKNAIKDANNKKHPGFYLTIIGKGSGAGKARKSYIPPELRSDIERFLDGPHKRAGTPKLLICKNNGERLGEHHATYLFNSSRKALIVGEDEFTLIDVWTDAKSRCFHSLRHSYATNMVKFLHENNLPLTILQELMGHSDIKTTMTYVHLDAYLHTEPSKTAPLTLESINNLFASE